MVLNTIVNKHLFKAFVMGWDELAIWSTAQMTSCPFCRPEFAEVVTRISCVSYIIILGNWVVILPYDVPNSDTKTELLRNDPGVNQTACLRLPICLYVCLFVSLLSRLSICQFVCISVYVCVFCCLVVCLWVSVSHVLSLWFPNRLQKYTFWFVSGVKILK